MKKLLLVFIVIIALYLWFYTKALGFMQSLNISSDFKALSLEDASIGYSTKGFFPLPYLKLANINAKNFSVQQMRIYPTFSIALRPMKFILEIDGGYILVGAKGGRELTTNMLKNLKTINIIGNYGELLAKNFQILSLEGRQLIANVQELVLAHEGNNFNLSGVINKNQKITGTLTGSNYSFFIEKPGYKVKVINDDIEVLKGSAELSIGNMLEFLSDVYQDFGLSTQEMNKEILNIKLKYLESEGEINLDAINISGVMAEGEGRAMDNSFIFNLNKLDLSNLLIAENIRNIFLGFAFNSKSDREIASEINIKELILGPNLKLQDSQLLGKLKEGTVQVSNLEAKIFPNGKIKLSGNLAANNDLHEFNGNVSLFHEDIRPLFSGYLAHTNKNGNPSNPLVLDFKSGLKITPRDIVFDNINSNLKDVSFSGHVSIQDFHKDPRTSCILRVNNLNIGDPDYPFVQSLLAYITSLTKNMKDRSFLQHFQPIRNAYVGSYDIDLYDLYYGDENKIDNLRIVADSSPGNFNITDFYLDKAGSVLHANAELEVRELQPNIHLHILESNLDFDILEVFSKASEYIKENIDFSHVNADIVVDKALARSGDTKITDLKLTASNKGNLVEFSLTEGNLWNGIIEARGSMSLNPFRFNCAYALNSFNIKTPFSLFGLKYEGLASIRGDISTGGDTLEKIFYHLSSQGEFVSKNLEIENFAIDQFISKVRESDYSTLQLDQDKAIISNGNTTLQGLKGQYDFSRGVASLKDVVFTTKHSSGALVAALNSYNWELKTHLKFSFYPEKTEGNNPQPLVIDYFIEGTIQDPKINIDTQDLEKFLGGKNNTPN